MNTPIRIQPRFIPTLTEVVDPTSLSSHLPSSKSDIQEIVAIIKRQIQPIIDQRIQTELDQLIRTVVQTQSLEISARVQRDIEIVISQAVTEAWRSP
jgi:transcription termination factor NusB